MKIDSFIFYRSFRDALKYLPDKERLEAYDLICGYGLDHIETETENPVVNGMLALIKPQLDANYKRKQDGGKGGRPSKTEAQFSEELEDKADCKPLVIETENHRFPNEKPNVNVNDNVNANENVNVKINKRFTKPTIDEIRSYCQERKNGVDAERFFNYYESNGWRVGKNPMKDWKACVRTWEQNNPKPQTEERKVEQLWY